VVDAREDDDYSGTIAVEERHRIDNVRLGDWMCEHVEGYAGPLTILQLWHYQRHAGRRLPRRRPARSRLHYRTYDGCGGERARHRATASAPAQPHSRRPVSGGAARRWVDASKGSDVARSNYERLIQTSQFFREEVEVAACNAPKSNSPLWRAHEHCFSEKLNGTRPALCIARQLRRHALSCPAMRRTATAG
jgi:hypothetical protein